MYFMAHAFHNTYIQWLKVSKEVTNLPAALSAHPCSSVCISEHELCFFLFFWCPCKHLAAAWKSFWWCSACHFGLRIWSRMGSHHKDWLTPATKNKNIFLWMEPLRMINFQKIPVEYIFPFWCLRTGFQVGLTPSCRGYPCLCLPQCQKHHHQHLR